VADRVLAEIWRLVEAEPSTRPAPSPVVALLRRVCGAATRQLDVSGCWVRLMTETGASGVAAVSDATGEVLEELQFTLGEGPCIDAFSSRRPVLESDLGAVDPVRWPVFTPTALAAGARAVFAFPLQVGAARLGVLGLYSDRTGALDADALGRALAFVEVATEAALDGGRYLAEQRPYVPHDSMDRAEIHQAQGMVMVQLGTDLVTAMIRLRAHAYGRDRRLGDVARDVVAGRLRLDSSH
jgi:hypothetical protein